MYAVVNWGDTKTDTLRNWNDTIIYHAYATTQPRPVSIQAYGCGKEMASWQSTYSGLPTLYEEAFKLYPNPSSNEFTIDLVEIGEGGFCNISNLNGQVLATYPLFAKQQKVSIAALPAGLYFVSIHNGSGQLYTTKLIVQK